MNEAVAELLIRVGTTQLEFGEELSEILLLILFFRRTMKLASNPRQEEYEFRQKLISELNERITCFITSYFKKYSNNLGYILVYPLLCLEERCIELKKEGSISSIEQERYAISWFVRQMLKLGSCNTAFRFEKEEYNEFKQLYHKIENAWEDYEYMLRLNDMFSYGQYKVEIRENNVQIIIPSIMNSMADASIYYRGIHDRDGMHKESEAVERIMSYLRTRNLKQFQKIARGGDQQYIELCVSRVDKDFSKLGGNIISASIEQMTHFRRFVAYLYSLCQFKLFCKLAGAPGI